MEIYIKLFEVLFPVFFVIGIIACLKISEAVKVIPNPISRAVAIFAINILILNLIPF